MLGLAGLSSALLYDKYGSDIKKVANKTMKKAKNKAKDTLEDIEDSMM